MELFFTDPEALETAGVSDAHRALERHGLHASAPFILESDGRYDIQLNRFLWSLPTLGVRSANSWRAYALDLLTWARFLEEHRCKTVWHADRDDVTAFHRARRVSPDPTQVVSASTWNRSVAALDKFYSWALDEGLIDQTPFRYSESSRHIGGGNQVRVRNNRAMEKAAKRGDVRFLSVPRYTAFRDVGLRGLLPAGGDDRTFRGRNAERNVVMTELLVTTGLRIEEAASLCWPELPALDGQGSAKSVAFDLAPPTTKRDKGRKILLPKRVLRALTDYIEIERSLTLARWHAHGCSLPAGAVLGSQADRRGVRLPTKEGHPRRVPWSRVPPEVRARLYLVDEQGLPLGPACVWVGQEARPVSLSAWESVFVRASERCREHGIDVAATPHVLRHTFAVHLLSALIQEQIGSVNRRELTDGVYRRIIGDPLDHLRRLLGHASITTTYIYLDCTDQAQGLIDDAVDAWTSEVVDTAVRISQQTPSCPSAAAQESTW
ncbi:site-specific integrase [Streptacidiphilus sp. PB12-B1b]|uniref:tyrosine-type recombinase/integrase n=1 Tax=Streptacidiphilus sp. PB12-B1b TaxID=2705012 RepID=UPI0015FD6069|nr:tyrosine-type recombinase/integrase [Streptacidiphilus sp. PB12-B1b]QMU75976.1 site-specific integrase [Streptacidiphilus sp. PB12-B1b]